MNIGNKARPRYVCDKCKREIPYTYRQGFKVNKYGKWTNSCYSKDFDLCSSCEEILREWLNTKEIPTTKDIINTFPRWEDNE